MKECINTRLHRMSKMTSSGAAQKKVTASQLIQWRILVHFQDKYFPTYAWKLLTGDIDTLFPDAFIQMAVFKGNTRAVFLDRKEAKGPIDRADRRCHGVRQKATSNLGSRIADVYREDIYELPMDSVRELISNAVCHQILYCLPDPSRWQSMMTVWKSHPQAG